MIAIINSPLFRDKNPLYDEDSLPPIGLGYIATNLKNREHNVELIDAVARNITIDELISILSTTKPDFIGLNIFTTNYDLVKEIVELIEFKSHIIIGGLSTKTLYQSIFDWNTANQIDIVIGDGELITTDIVENTIKVEPLAQSKNRRVYSIDSSSEYYVKDISNSSLDRIFFVNEPLEHPLGFKEANIITSRGCIYNCAFCAAARSKNLEFGIREKSIASIKDELNEIQEIYPNVTSIRVLDDLFLKTNRSLQKAFEVFNDFSFTWRSMAHVMTFEKANPLLIEKLKHSGCSELFIGVESGSPKILRSIHKTPSPNIILRNLSSIMKAGIDIKAYFIYGFPNETNEDMELTYKLAAKLKNAADKYGVNFRTSVFQFRPYHGTELYHQIEIEKKIDSNVRLITPNTELSDLVGRIQFNFHSGNYSMVASDKLYSYIYHTTELSNGKFIEAVTNNKPKVK